MEDGHLTNLKRFLERRLEIQEERRMDFDLSHIDGKDRPGFSGLEDATKALADALFHVRVEMECRATTH